MVWPMMARTSSSFLALPVTKVTGPESTFFAVVAISLSRPRLFSLPVSRSPVFFLFFFLSLTKWRNMLRCTVCSQYLCYYCLFTHKPDFFVGKSKVDLYGQLETWSGRSELMSDVWLWDDFILGVG
uniref:Uncharacterized protein MANES_15G048800 n=1 Tax=Rhizophora mucronata TaxID=61149 RepID=A0A2P2JJF0_RHIMU